MANRVMKFLIIGLLSSAFVRAQETPKPLPRHPGDVVKYEIKFDGSNAEKIKTVSTRMYLDGTIQKDQSGFTPQFNTPGQVQPIAPTTFIVEMKVPPDIATGEYRLYVNAYATEGSVQYSDMQDSNVPAIRIENPAMFTPPGIKFTPLP